jgi:thioesterase domain-containing protein
MKDTSIQIIFLPGAGGKAPDLNAFQQGEEAVARFEVIGYPGWKRYVADYFSAETLIAEIAAQIAAKIPSGPVRIVGSSIGGHFAYGVALRLQEMGYEIRGFCAIDSFMIASAAPTAGWKRRALAEGLVLLRRRRFGEFTRFLRSKFWRLLVRLADSRSPSLLQRPSFKRLLSVAMFDQILDDELSMYLLIKATAPWIASLDREPVALGAPAILLRTQATARDDPAWLRRCPGIKILEIRGQHHSVYEPENVDALRNAFLSATRDWH